MQSSKPVCLITGGTGTLGTSLALKLADHGYKVRTLSRSEQGREKLKHLIQQHPLHNENISILAGDVCDPDRLKLALRGVDIVIHAAALKRIDLCEYDPIEAVRVNVHGTAQVIQAAIAEGVSKAVLISTDKACAPSTLYGATKLSAERMWLSANVYAPCFMALRYGNVFGSAGSVLHAFQAQAHQLTLTDPDATRFHITLASAVELVCSMIQDGKPGELCIPKLPSYTLSDLATAFMATKDRPWSPPKVIGLRACEKKHEQLISIDESESLMKINLLNYALEPGKVHQPGHRWSYASDTNPDRLSVSALKEIILEHSQC